MPGSPTIAKIWPLPDAASSTSLLKTSISVRRPTNGVSPRTAAACTRVRAVVAATTSKASTGRETPLTCHRANRFDLNESFYLPQRGSRHQCRSTRRKLLHPGRQVRRMAQSGIVDIEIVADGTHHNFAGIQADADL